MNDRAPALANIYSCTGCMGCIDICPVNALSSYINEEGHYAVKMDKDKCVKCLKCEAFCRNQRSNYGTDDLKKSSIYAGWANDVKIRMHATSGGIFGAVATSFINKGGVVAGAFFDGNKCKHIIITEVCEVEKLQGSKYAQSETKGIYKSIERYISDTPVLFSGTGCECAAVIEYFRNSRFAGNLYTVDLVCGGVPSTFLLDRYFEKNKDIERILSFRSKERYELTVVKGDQISTDQIGLPITGFAYEMTNRYSCYDCKFAYPHRKSDLTIGDLWGDTGFREERKKGISMIICHSIKGERLLKESDITLRTADWKSVLQGNKRIIYGKAHSTAQRIHMKKAFNEKNYDELLREYGMNSDRLDVKILLMKVNRKIWYLFHGIKAEMKIDRALRGTKNG